MSKQTVGEINAGGTESGNHVRYERCASEPLSVTAARAIAAYFGEEVTTSSIPLYEYVDPEALDALFEPKRNGSARSQGQITFRVEEATVHITPSSVQVSDT